MISKPSDRSGPELILRVPGPWKSPQDLKQALPERVQLCDEGLMMPGGEQFELFVRPMDADLPQFFASSCREKPTATQMRAIENATAIVGLVGPGGNLDAARRFLEAGAALVRADGYGVFLDNSGRVHLASDWLELAENSHDIEALVYAVVNLVAGHQELFTVGMHCLGCRDLALMGSRDPGHADFLLAVAANIAGNSRQLEEDGVLQENGLLQDRHFGQFRVSTGTCGQAPDDSPMHNPYGAWRLAAVTP